MSWYEISVNCTGEEAGAVVSCMEAAGALAVSLLDQADTPVFEPEPGHAPLWRATRVQGLFPPDDATFASLRAELRRVHGAGTARFEVEVAVVEDRDWVGESQAGFGAMDFGRGLWIVPPGGPLPPQARAVVRMEPGVAFGTGTHPTTRLCLEWLAGIDQAGRRIIDYGCGSGVLGIASAALGARQVIMLDTDPQALGAAALNAERNGVSTRVELCAPPLPGHAMADVLVANILLGPLVRLAPELGAGVNRGGLLCLSGVLEEQVGELAEAYAPWFEMGPMVALEGWARVPGRRR